MYSLDPRANPHCERFLQPHLRPHRSPSDPPSPGAGANPPQLRSHKRRNRSGGGAAPARLPSRQRDRLHIPALRDRPGLRRGASPPKVAFFLFRREKLPPPHTPSIFHLQ